MSTALSILADVLPRSIRPRARILVSEWADLYRRLSPETSSEPGAWRTSYTPYLREIMDTFVDPHVHEVVIMKSAQIGVTQGAFLNIIGYAIDREPGPMLYYLPSLDVGKKFSKKIFNHMVRDCDVLRDKVADPRDRDANSTTLEKSFPGGDLIICGSNSSSGFRMLPRRIIFEDDLDAFAEAVGDEGDPVALAKVRTRTYQHTYKIYLASSPTTEEKSKIYKEFLTSDQRHYHVPCPHCGIPASLEWENMHATCGLFDAKVARIRADSTSPDKTSLLSGFNAVWYECPHCSGRIEETDRRQMLAGGSWVPSFPGRERRGYHINAIYSPFVSFRDLMTAYVEGLIDPEKMIVFINTMLGLPILKDKSERKIDSILILRDERARGEVPPDTQGLYAAIDTQATGFYYEIYAPGWGMNLPSWTVREGYTETWDSLDEILFSDRYYDTAGNEYRVRGGAIDSGGTRSSKDGYYDPTADSRTDEVYLWCYLHRTFVPIKGSSTKMLNPWRISHRDKFPNGKPIKGGLDLYIIDTGYYKDRLSSKLKIAPGDPGSRNLHREITPFYAEQMIVEYKDTKGDWQCPKGKPNHFWDVNVYREFFIDMKGLKFKRRPDPVGADAPPPRPPAPPPPPQRNSRW